MTLSASARTLSGASHSRAAASTSRPMGGAVSRVAPDATAFVDRDVASTLLITSGWRGPHESAARIAWVRETWNAVQPFTKPSAYVNYLDRR